jgi:hypothetical protein
LLEGSGADAPNGRPHMQGIICLCNLFRVAASGEACGKRWEKPSE